MSAAPRVISIDTLWRDKLILWGKHPRASLWNAAYALRHAPEWAGVLAKNEMTHYVNTLKPTPWGAVTDSWSDNDDTRVCEWLQEQHINVGSEVTFRVVQMVASENSYHPVRDYLEGLTWDGKPRVDDWLLIYMGAKPDPSLEYVQAVGAGWLISAVARAMRPGCQVDTCLVLQGKQGLYKSTAFRIMGGKWFADQLSNVASKDACLQLRVWIMELAEFDVALRVDPATLKAFLTRQRDHFRPPYGRHVIDVERPCVFGGTVNEDEYLQDATGGRRFWPVCVTGIQRDMLERDRDQLWAEAMFRYQAGERWWLNDAMELEAEHAQLERQDTDPWTEPVLAWVAKLGSHEVGLADILRDCIGKNVKEQNKHDKNRIGRIMKSAGWNYKLVGPTGSRTRRYTR